MPLRRDAGYDYADDEVESSPRERRGIRISFRDGLIPKTLWGRIATGSALVLIACATIAAAIEVRGFLLHDARFIVPNEEAIEIAGASHLTHAQLLSVFGEDVDRNIFLVPLNERRAELERLPWVEHATVMRLLPNHLRVAIVERTPVAFVRQGAQIGLVDANGVLFDLPSPEMVAAGGGGTPHYSFPVLTGISATDPLSTRAARMKIYMGFLGALDATGEKISSKLSEVDVSDPEDVRAVVPDAGGSDVLVHFGEDRFLERYHAYQQHLAEWRAQYPRLTSADMRYEQQVVLGMKDAPAVSAAGTPSTSATQGGQPSPSTTAASNGLAKASNMVNQPAPVKQTSAAVVHSAMPRKAASHPLKHISARPKKSAVPRAKAKSATPLTHSSQGVAK